MMDMLILSTDIGILVWLIGTWFYEGHHRRCKVEVVCSICGKSSDHTCSADHKNA